MGIRLIALDLDGTLLTDEKRIHPPTAEVLREVGKNGVRVVLASARPPRSVRAFYAELGLDTLQINYNGAMIWDEPEQRAFYHQPMAGELALQIVTHSRCLYPGVLASLEVMDRWYTDYVDPRYATETAKFFEPDGVGPIHTFCDQPITKLMLLAPLSTIISLHETLKFAYPDEIALTRCDDHLLQIMHKSASKAAAMKMIAEHYGVGLSEVLAIGDAPNDLEMLQCAGHSAAVGNAHECVKEIAAYTAAMDTSEGVLDILRHYRICAT